MTKLQRAILHAAKHGVTNQEEIIILLRARGFVWARLRFYLTIPLLEELGYVEARTADQVRITGRGQIVLADPTA